MKLEKNENGAFHRPWRKSGKRAPRSSGNLLTWAVSRQIIEGFRMTGARLFVGTYFESTDQILDKNLSRMEHHFKDVMRDIRGNVDLEALCNQVYGFLGAPAHGRGELPFPSAHQPPGISNLRREEREISGESESKEYSRRIKATATVGLLG